MANCKECIHYGICIWTQVNTEKKKVCKDFKNKADFVEVVHGEWIAINSNFGTPAGITMNGVTGYKCSLCGRQEISKEPYCNCGAIMDGERSDT